MNRIPSGCLVRRVAAALAVAFVTASLVHAEPGTPAPADTGSSTAGNAGQRGDRPGRRDGEQPRPAMQVFEGYRSLLESLKLDKDQSKQVRDIMQETRESMRALQQDGQTMSGKDRLASFSEALDTLDGKISAILNDGQKKTFETGTADIRAKVTENLKQQAGRPNRAGGDGATTGPSTRPGGPGGLGGGAPGGRMMDRVQRAMDDAGLSDDQKTKMKPLLDEAREKIAALIADARANGNAADPQAIRGQVRDIFADVAKKAGDFLTPEQIDKLKASLQPNRPGGGGGNGGGNGGNGGNGGQPKGDGTPPTPPPPGAEKSPADQPPADKPADKPAAAVPAGASNIAQKPEAGSAGLAASAAPKTSGALALGDALPPFSLTKLDGHVITNKSLNGKPCVLIFGSLTAPPFRDHIALIQQLAKKYSSRVNWLVIYSREMHPMGTDEPERNRDDHIQVAAHKTAADRIAAAKTAHDQLTITLDMATDAIDDVFTNACGGFPNAALLVSADGHLAARQDWAEAFAIERAVDRELKRK